MSTGDPRALVHSIFAAIDRREFDEVRQMFGPTYLAHFDGLPPMTPNELFPFMGAFFTAFPDLQHRVEDVRVDGDRIAARVVITGTHLGEFMGAVPTQRPVTFGSINIYHLADGKIAEHWVNVDTFGMLQQIGAIPAPRENLE
jgi:predicted SnoaL-like aldol condensation-catalyzing enzyme